MARFLDSLVIGIGAVPLAMIFGAERDLLVTELLSGLVGFVYFVAFETSLGWTPAKTLVGVSVRGPGGARKPNVKQSAVRNSFMLLGAVPLIGGLISMIAYIVVAATISRSPTKVFTTGWPAAPRWSRTCPVDGIRDPRHAAPGHGRAVGIACRRNRPAKLDIASDLARGNVLVGAKRAAQGEL